jgi:hypothetical protein
MGRPVEGAEMGGYYSPPFGRSFIGWLEILWGEDGDFGLRELDSSNRFVSLRGNRSVLPRGNRNKNDFEYRVRLSQHFVVPESKHPQSTVFEVAISLQIIRSLFLMLAAIDLDDELRFETCEIDDVASNGYLAPKSVSSKLSTTQMVPEDTLGIGRAFSQALRALLS